jgi:hypothetical protein
MANLTGEWNWYLIIIAMVLLASLLALAVKLVFWGCWIYAPSLTLIVLIFLPRTLTELRRALACIRKARRSKKPKPPPVVIGGLPQRHRKTKATGAPRMSVVAGGTGVQHPKTKGEVMRELGLSYVRLKDNKRCSEPESPEYTPQGSRLRSHVKMQELIALVEQQGEVRIPAKAQIGVHHADSICSMLKAELRRSGKHNIEVIKSGGYIIVKGKRCLK